MKRLFFILSLVTIQCLCFQASNFASDYFFEDTKNYAGSHCLPDDQNAEVNRAIGVLWSLNKSGTRRWICPIVNDDDNSYDRIDGWVVVYDRNHSTDVTCSLRSVETTTGLYKYSKRSSSGFAYGSMKLSFSTLYNYEHAALKRPIAVMECSIPSLDYGYYSGIKKYHIREY